MATMGEMGACPTEGASMLCDLTRAWVQKDISDEPVDPFDKELTCPKCGAKGTAFHNRYLAALEARPETPCKACDGRGFHEADRGWFLLLFNGEPLERQKCLHCSSTGKISKAPAYQALMFRCCPCGWGTVQAPLDAEKGLA